MGELRSMTLSSLAGIYIISSIVLALPSKDKYVAPSSVTLRQKVALKCDTDGDCLDLILCKDDTTNCYCNQRTQKCDWTRPETRARWRRSAVNGRESVTPDDIGPDTCGKARHLLSNWFLRHGGANLLEEPIPELVLPTAPNPYDDPNKPPLHPYPLGL